MTKDGHSAIVSTTGNEDCHVILRGGKQPNYDAAQRRRRRQESREAGIPARIMIDFSHGNSGKNPQKQVDVGHDVAARSPAATRASSASWSRAISRPAARISCPAKHCIYGLSITDGCIGWEDSRALLDTLAEAVRKRRLKAAESGESE